MAWTFFKRASDGFNEQLGLRTPGLEGKGANIEVSGWDSLFAKTNSSREESDLPKVLPIAGKLNSPFS